jgi:hypothetical protein
MNITFHWDVTAWVLLQVFLHFRGTEYLHLQYHRVSQATSNLSDGVGPGTSFLTRMTSSGMLRYVALVRTDVSEELSASFIRVTRIGELGTLAVTSNRRMLQRNTKQHTSVASYS